MKNAKYQPMIREYDAPASPTKFEGYWARGHNRVKWTVAIASLLVVLAGARSVAAYMMMDERPVIDPAVRAMPSGSSARVLVELRARTADPSAVSDAQNEVLRRLAGTGARLARRYTTAPLLALEIDATALARLEEMTGLVIRVRPDRIAPPLEGSQPRR
jgi:hypothetical protein